MNGICTKNQNKLHNRADEVQNQINAIRDSLQVIEGNLIDFVDDYYTTQFKVELKHEGVNSE